MKTKYKNVKYTGNGTAEDIPEWGFSEFGGTPRSGRWWWEQSEHKECGLHQNNYSI